MANEVNDKSLFLGIDGGGSKCKARLVSGRGEFLGSGLSGPANPLHDFERTQQSIREATELALDDAGLDHSEIKNLIAGVALAGVNVPSVFNTMNNWAHPFLEMHLSTDLHAACLGAHQGKDGAVIIVGTGSCGYASMNGEKTILGAHGFQLGDKGSGAWIGAEALRAVLMADDELAPATILTDAITRFYNCAVLDLIDTMSGAKSCDFARLAPLVFDLAEKGDEVALSILKDGAAYIEAIARKLLSLQPPRLSMIGGISARMMPLFDPAIAAEVSLPLEQPEAGSVYFAQTEHFRLANQENNNIRLA